MTEAPRISGGGVSAVAERPAPPSPERRARIAVICAENIRNSGMYSVDCAAIAFFSALPCDFELFVTQFRGDAGSRVEDRVKTRLVDMSQLDGFSHIVFWGDYLNNPVYGLTDFARRDMNYGHAKDRMAGYARWADFFTFRQKAPTSRVISVGNNFQHDFSENEAMFRPALRRIETYFSAILPRDPFSVQNLSRNLSFDELTKVRPGMDCAFLLPQTEREKKDQFCYFFGRSGFGGRDSLVRRIAEKSGLKPVELGHWLSLSKADPAGVFAGLRETIAASRFAVTDTYHMAINALVQHVPVIGLGKAAGRQRGTLGDFKKRVLFSMLGQSDLYFEMDDEAEERFFDRVTAGLGPLNRVGRFNLQDALAAKFRKDVEEALFA